MLGRAALQAGFRPGAGDAGRRRAAAARRGATPPRPSTRAARGRADRRACAAASSPAPTPASARPSSRRRSPRRCARAACASRAFKPVVTGLDEPEPGRPADHELLGAAAGGDPRTCHAATLRPGRLAAPRGASSPASTLDPATLVAARARRRGAAPTCSSPRASAGCSCRSPAGYACATSRVDARPAARRRRAPRPRDDQPHAADARGRARRRPRRARGRAHAVAGAADRRWSAPTARRSSSTATPSGIRRCATRFHSRPPLRSSSSSATLGHSC